MNKEGSFLRIIRFYQFLYKMKLKPLAKLVKILIGIVFSCDIPVSCTLGKGTVFPHFALGVVIHPKCIIGENCKIYQRVTIGSRNASAPPKMGNNILIGSGACIIGDITIGDNVSIGSNSVVLTDVPSNSTVVGIPGRIIRKV